MKIGKAHCPNCDGERKCIVHGHVQKNWDWEDRYGNSVNGGHDYSLFECQGCETVFYEDASWNSEERESWYGEGGRTCSEHVTTKKTWPTPDGKARPAWLDAIAAIDVPLYSLLAEMYLAYEVQVYVLTAIGLRTALDRSTEVLEIDPALRFEEKLDRLQTSGWIGETEREVLGIVTDAGNAAVHRAWEPSSGEVRQLLTALEVFLQRAFIVGKKVLTVKGGIPPRPRRKSPDVSSQKGASRNPFSS